MFPGGPIQGLGSNLFFFSFLAVSFCFSLFSWLFDFPCGPILDLFFWFFVF